MYMAAKRKKIKNNCNLKQLKQTSCKVWNVWNKYVRDSWCIRYHFLSWFACHKRCVKQKCIRNTLNKPCRAELVTSRNRDYIGPISHIKALIFLYTIENSPMDVSRESQTSMNTSARIRTLVEVRNCTRSESLSKVHGRESLIFQIYVTFSVDFPNIYNNYFLYLANVTNSFL